MVDLYQFFLLLNSTLCGLWKAKTNDYKSTIYYHWAWKIFSFPHKYYWIIQTWTNEKVISPYMNAQISLHLALFIYTQVPYVGHVNKMSDVFTVMNT